MTFSALARHRSTGSSGALLAPTIPAKPPAAAPAPPTPPAAPGALGAEALPPGLGETVNLIAGRLVAHAAPLVQADAAMQTRIGSAAGSAAASHLSGYALAATGAVVLASGVVIWSVLTR